MVLPRSSDKAHTPFLNIAIPTYNRSEKLKRALNAVKEQIEGCGYQEAVCCSVSNNASTDDTAKILDSFQKENLDLNIYHQSENIGMDRNMEFLFHQARSEYVWFLSDDDLLVQNALERIMQVLKQHLPTALLFEFEQPPGHREHYLSRDLIPTIVTSPIHIISLVIKVPKITSYVLRRSIINNEQLQAIDKFLGNSFWFVTLTFSLFASEDNPRLCVIPEFLAASDEDYNILRFSPQVWGNWYKIFRHPYVITHAPNRWKTERVRSYLSYINFLYAFKTGELIASQPDEYEKAVKEFELRPVTLIRNPRVALQAIALKLGVVAVLQSLKFRIKKCRSVCK